MLHVRKKIKNQRKRECWTFLKLRMPDFRSILLDGRPVYFPMDCVAPPTALRMTEAIP
jgi:hypothetical protein